MSIVLSTVSSAFTLLATVRREGFLWWVLTSVGWYDHGAAGESGVGNFGEDGGGVKTLNTGIVGHGDPIRNCVLLQLGN